MIKNETQYNAIMKRIDQLLEMVDDNTPEDNPEYIELMLLTDLVESYEDEHYPIERPPLDEVIEPHLALAQNQAQQKAYQATAFAMIEGFWRIGRRIVEEEQQGSIRAIVKQKWFAKNQHKQGQGRMAIRP